MIDLTNAPEGATYYFNQLFYKFHKGVWMFCVEGVWVKSSNINDWFDDNLVLIKNDWSIYNNTLPLSELSDEQAAELFNYARHGGIIEATYGHANIDVSNHTWFPDAVYRAKQKTERELFIDKWMGFTAKNATLDALSIGHRKMVLGAMFDAGFKAPKVGE
jgi:hypothetical protein